MIGELAILNVAAGDTKLTFDPANKTETARACGIVKDMLRRGFVLLIEAGSDDKGPIYRRALDFDEQTAEYIIAGTVEESANDEKPASPPKTRRAAKAAPRERLPAKSTKAVAVARTAGG